MYTREEKIHGLMNDISNGDHFIMAGSMTSFHEHFDPFFELGIILYVKPDIRIRRVHQRELEEFGNRILEGGDMYEEHQDFLKLCRNYEHNSSPNMKTHLSWINDMPCEVLYLDGEVDINDNLTKIIEYYKNSDI